MRSLYNLSIRAKILLIISPLLAGVFYLILIRTIDSLNLSQSMSRLEKGVSLSTDISYLVHEIQKERGNSAGYLANQSEGFRSQLDDQRKLTDEQYENFKSALLNPDLSDIADANESALQELSRMLREIEQIRLEVDQVRISSNEAIDRYTEINTYALNTLDQVIPTGEQSDVTREVQAYINFLKSKERAGIERAIGSQAFSLGALNAELYRRFSTLVAAQESYIDAFLLTANDESKAFFENTIKGSSVDEVERMRAIMYANVAVDEDPIYWFATITKKIELLKSVEDFLTDKVVEKATDLSQQANTEFWIFLITTLVLVLLDLVILFAVLRNLLGNINLLSGFAQKIEKGNLNETVSIKAADELGQFAGVLNNSVKSLDTARNELNEEKNKAEHLYETIYKTSEVVFANVEQGVFLITEDMKISDLYSKAMERIFEKKDLSGMDFMELLNPMLVPRDREALKVFSRHLFNARVKDNVLKRLNPVEEVQIFSGSRKTADDMNVKHIKVQFSRVVNNKKIENVMITVQDVTQEILLQQKIRDNEEKNRQETEQLLSIIKINPVLLRQYLERASEGLNEIYERYEADKSKDFKGLLKFTFNIVHNLKGNAALIDLDLMEERFHRIEETLIKLRDTEVSGGDFLQVLYEINDIKGIIMDMSGMIRRIADIYYNATPQEEIYSNDKLINGFERALKRLAQETGKKAKLVFDNPGNITFPEKVKLPLNDMIVQLLRNSMAHGIESPEERLSNGKSETGIIKLSVEQTMSGSLFISYSDDGRGLNEDKILLEAQKKGTIEEGDKITTKDRKKAYELIFEDGFSTVDKATVHAGRGQGMSVVRSSLEKIHGNYEIKSSHKEGFEISFSVPMSSQPIDQNITV